MENVPDSSQSRIKLVNDTVECDASAFSEAGKALKSRDMGVSQN